MQQLTLRLANMSTLPDGGPVEVSVDEGRSLDVGRDYGMGWVLPDPQRIVSGRHFEVRWERGSWMLYDLSTNGTYLNGASSRVKSPHRLESGDELQLGPYMIRVELTQQQGASPAPVSQAPAGGGFPDAPAGGGFGGAGAGGGSGSDIWSAFGAPAGAASSPPTPAAPTPASAPQSVPPGGGAWGQPPQPLPQGAPPSPPAETSPFASSPAGPTEQAPAEASPFGTAPGHGGDGGPAAQPRPPGDSPFGGAAPAGNGVPASPPGAGSEGSPFGPGAAPGHAPPGAPQSVPPGPAGGPAGGQAGTFPPQQSPAAFHPPQGYGAPQPQAPHPQSVPPASGGFTGQPASFPPQHRRAEPPPQPGHGGQAGPGASGDGSLLDQICAGAGLPPGSLGAGAEAETAREIGQALRVVAEDLAMLLQARAIAKQSVRSGQRTMIGREDNNPLKFLPGPEEALRAMFGPQRIGYMRGSAAIRQGFDDVKRHQHATHAAIQPALARLLDDLAPESIEARAGKSLLASKKARAWEVYVQRWDAKVHAHDNGMLDVFLKHFAEAYDQQTRG